MDHNFIDVMYLNACGTKGLQPKPGIYDFKEIYRISIEQGVWRTVFLAVRILYENNQIEIDDKDFDTLKRLYQSQVVREMQRYTYVHNLLGEFAINDIVGCILKGESLARYYAVPESRESADVDILIPKDREKESIRLLEKNGFKIQKREYGSHHFRAVHPVVGLLEIHTSMYGKKTDDICFNNSIAYKEAYEEFRGIDGTPLKTLGVTDTMIFLLMHFIKHFLSEGITVKHLNDILLYIEREYDKIHWNRIEEILKNLNFDILFLYLIDIGKKYMEFPDYPFDQDDTDIDVNVERQLLTDMYCGGQWGKQADREGFYDLYLKKRFRRFRVGDYTKYQKTEKIKGGLTRIFPNRRFMSINYKYVEQYPFLLPFAWIHRMFHGISGAKEANHVQKQELSERMKLMEKLDLI